MRKTDSGEKTPLRVSLSFCAVCRSEPKGFSTTTRRQVSGLSSVRPCSCSWPTTSPK